MKYILYITVLLGLLACESNVVPLEVLPNIVGKWESRVPSKDDDPAQVYNVSFFSNQKIAGSIDIYSNQGSDIGWVKAMNFTFDHNADTTKYDNMDSVVLVSFKTIPDAENTAYQIVQNQVGFVIDTLDDVQFQGKIGTCFFNTPESPYVFTNYKEELLNGMLVQSHRRYDIRPDEGMASRLTIEIIAGDTLVHEDEHETHGLEELEGAFTRGYFLFDKVSKIGKNNVNVGIYKTGIYNGREVPIRYLISWKDSDKPYIFDRIY